MLHRPYIRNSTREEVENRAEKNENGKFLDANTGKPIDKSYDLGHKPGHEYRYEKAQAEREGLCQKEFNDRMNNPDYYQIEDPSTNRSHKYEMKTDPYQSNNENKSNNNTTQKCNTSTNGNTLPNGNIPLNGNDNNNAENTIESNTTDNSEAANSTATGSSTNNSSNGESTNTGESTGNGESPDSSESSSSGESFDRGEDGGQSM